MGFPRKEPLPCYKSPFPLGTESERVIPSIISLDEPKDWCLEI